MSINYSFILLIWEEFAPSLITFFTLCCPFAFPVRRLINFLVQRNSCLLLVMKKALKLKSSIGVIVMLFSCRSLFSNERIFSSSRQTVPKPNNFLLKLCSNILTAFGC